LAEPRTYLSSTGGSSMGPKFVAIGSIASYQVRAGSLPP